MPINSHLLLALLSQDPYQGVTRLASQMYFTYDLEGETVVATDEDIAAIVSALSALADAPVKLDTFVVPGFEAQEQLGLSPADALAVLRGAVERGALSEASFGTANKAT